MGMTPQFRDLVIRTIIGEAGNQPPDGQAAVANVIKNRADSGAWGDATNGGGTRVITAPKQFSLWNAGDPAGAMAKSASANSPLYQRVGAIADQVFNGQVADNTGGATHYYNPSVASPDWGNGPGQMIGAHKFMKLPLNQANTAGTAVISPSTVGQGQSAQPQPATPAAGPSDTDVQSARDFLSTISQHSDRAGDTANLNPQFATALANSIKQARAEGLNVSVMSAFREPGQTGSAYDAGGNSSHSYGLASDIAGLDGPNGKITQRWAQIAAQNGLHNPYGTDNKTEFNHWQLPAAPLEQTPALLAALKTAKTSGDWNKIWSAYSDASPESQIATRQTYPPVASSSAAAPTVNPNVPAANAQPVSATAPAGASPTPGPATSAPGSDKYSVIQGMTTGTSHNPQLTTAANWGNLFGGAAPSAPPAAAPAAVSAATPRPASAPAAAFDPKNPPLPPERPAAPIDANNPLPWTAPAPTAPSIANVPLPPERPLTLPTLSAGDFNAPHVPNWGPWHAGGAPSGPIIASPSAQTPSSIAPTWGAANPNDPDDLRNPDKPVPAWSNGTPVMTPGAPSMGFPAMTQPPTQVSQLPGSMFASAQNLIKYLFPSSVG